LTNTIGGAKIIHPKFMHLIIVTNTVKINAESRITKKEITHI